MSGRILCTVYPGNRKRGQHPSVANTYDCGLPCGQVLNLARKKGRSHEQGARPLGAGRIRAIHDCFPVLSLHHVGRADIHQTECLAWLLVVVTDIVSRFPCVIGKREVLVSHRELHQFPVAR